MADIGKIEVNFQVLNSGDPKILLVADYSKWRAIEEMPAYLEIIPPGSKKPVVVPFKKNSLNFNNSISLGLTCTVECGDNTQPLPDGMYEICLKGGKDGQRQEHKYYLKHDNFDIELDKAFTRLGIDYPVSELGYIKNLLKIKGLIEAASSATKRAEITQAQEYFSLAKKMLSFYDGCKNCL